MCFTDCWVQTLCMHQFLVLQLKINAAGRHMQQPRPFPLSLGWVDDLSLNCCVNTRVPDCCMQVQMLRAGTSSNAVLTGSSAPGGNGNSACYVRALSDQPQGFTSGFNKVRLFLLQKIAKCGYTGNF